MERLRYIIFIGIVLTSMLSCEKSEPNEQSDCLTAIELEKFENRGFGMGFSTWSFGPDFEDIEETYQFIENNADIYSEQLDYRIPWNAWINDLALPAEFVNDLAYRKLKKPKNSKLLVSVSLLNTDRSDLIEDYDGTTPAYTKLNDTTIENAYFKHLNYVIDNLQPNYLVLAIEVNELLIKSETKWTEYIILIENIRVRIKQKYPNLLLSESVTLHNWYKPEIENQKKYIDAINTHVNNLDFIAVSFYPFFKGLHSKTEFQLAFDFLHQQVNKPIAFVETSHLAENLEVKAYNLLINSSVCEQKEYLETLLLNAYNNNYQFVIWWTYRDFDELWNIFPEEAKDLGKLWRDTGILDENGNERPAYKIWKENLEKKPI